MNESETREEDETYQNGGYDVPGTGRKSKTLRSDSIKNIKWRLERLEKYFDARLAPFDIAELREIMSYDEMELDKIGDRKTALFLIMSDTDTTFNFRLPDV